MSTDQAVRNPLMAAVQACKRHFFAAAGFSFLLNMLYLAPTLYMLQVYDRVVPTRGVMTLVFLTVVFVFAVVTLSSLDFVRARLLVRASTRLDRQLAPRILSALFQRTDGTVRSAQALREFDMLRQNLTGIGVLALFDAPWTPIYIAICFLVHPALGALALFGSLTLLFLAFLNERATKAPLQRANEAAGRAYTSIDFSANAGGVLRALGMRRAMVERHVKERYLSSHLTAEANFSANTYLTFTKFTRLTLQSVSLGLGAYLAIEQKISAGAIFAASLLVTRALAPIEQVLGAWKGVVQSRGAYNSLKELFAKAGTDEPKTRLPQLEGHLRLERISVVSPARDRLILSDVNFQLEAGEALGVVGPSGAGKSTLVRVIAGALRPEQGAVRYDGADAKDWDEEQLAQYVGYVPQEPTLFAGTVKDNIARFQGQLAMEQEALDAAVVRAAQACGAHELILRLPKGYDTQLGYGGAGLSAGQAQRIALARAFFGDPTVLILDEPNAHLDSAGEADLLDALVQCKKRGVTVLIVAHRTSILVAVDKLLFLRDGRVEMMGPRDEVTQRLSGRQPQTPVIEPNKAPVLES